MRRWKAWFLGYVVVYLSGGDRERFFALCAHRGIIISKSFLKNGRSYACLSLRDYRRIGPIARKSGVLPIITKRVGLPFVLGAAQRHRTFCLGLALFVALLLLLEQFVWIIEVDGNYVRTDEQILQALEEYGVMVGCMRKRVVCEELEEYLRNAMNDLLWVSCEKDGTKLRIRVKEAYRYPQKADVGRETGDIVATEDGVVEQIVVRRGVPQVKEGDTVSKGQVLVSGTRILSDAYGEEWKREYVLAEADIVISHTVSYEETFSLVYEKKTYREKKKKKIAISAFDHEILKYNSSIPSAGCDIMITYADMRLFSRLYLPVRLSMTTYERYSIEEMRYSEEEARSEATKRYLRFLEDLIASGHELTDETMVCEISENRAIVRATVSVQSSAWEYRDIVIEERNTTEER